tara:strand:- start:136 stop:396 length:261 start_codon:yes stop_codon:yes gene_type:complete
MNLEAESLLDKNFTRTGLNADWYCTAWITNRENLFITHEEDDDRFALIHRVIDKHGSYRDTYIRSFNPANDQITNIQVLIEFLHTS